jgi:hypothetical protein
MRLSSAAFEDGKKIPSKYTCDGEDISPPLKIEAVPEGTRSLVLIVDDPDAPLVVFDHWLLWNIPADTKDLSEGLPQKEELQELGRAIQGRNKSSKIGYRGPCPPWGSHTYRFKLYALDKDLDLKPGSKKRKLERAMEGCVLDECILTGKYR